jgi:hypothetical protein
MSIQLLIYMIQNSMKSAQSVAYPIKSIKDS